MTDEGLIAEATQAITINADGTTSAIADDPVTQDNESAAHITAQYGLMPSALNLKYLIVSSCLLFGVASVVYGYITGGVLFYPFYYWLLGTQLFGVQLYEVVIPAWILFSLFGIATYSLKKFSDKPSKIADWLFPPLVGLLPVAVLVFFFGSYGSRPVYWDWYFRHYIALIGCYVLILFSLYTILFLKITKKPKGVGSRGFLLLMISISFFGVVLYFLKGGTLTQPYNFVMQFILSMLSVLPPYFAILAIRMKLLK